MKNENGEQSKLSPTRLNERGSVLVITLGIVAILMTIVGVTLLSTTNKYFTAYQWASWQEALQGAESGADIAMAEMRKDVTGSFLASPSATPWVGWTLANYTSVNGNKTRTIDTNSPQKNIAADGTFSGNSGGGGGNLITFNISSWTNDKKNNLGKINYDCIYYGTILSAHSGEGNQNMAIKVVVDMPSSLVDPAGRQWMRVVATGTTDLAGPTRASEEQLDNRLRKLGLIFDQALAATGIETDSTKLVRRTSRRIELVAKPVSLFAGAITTMVQFKDDGGATVTDSFNSEDPTHWPTIKDANGFDVIDMTVSHDPTSPLGKNGDLASNAFPIKHDHSQNLDIKGETIWGDVGNNYSQIKGIDPAYYNNNANAANYGLNNGNFGSTNPTPSLIKTDAGADVSGNIATNYYRDLPAVQNPNWSSSTFFSKVDKGTADINNISTDPTNPTHIQIGTSATPGNLTLSGGDKWTFKAAKKPGGWTVNTPPIHSYVEVWVTGDIKLDDGGTVVLEEVDDPGSGKVISDVSAVFYFDRNIKIGETKETKTNAGGFDNQSDDSKNLILLGVTEPNGAQKLPKDAYTDPLGNESLYTPYKATGNILFKENDFTGAIYAPDHNIVFDNSKDGKGKRKKRKQDGSDFYGSYVGRTIHSKKAHNYHFDESLNDAGVARDWGFVSWYEDVDVDHRQTVK